MPTAQLFETWAPTLTNFASAKTDQAFIFETLVVWRAGHKRADDGPATTNHGLCRRRGRPHARTQNLCITLEPLRPLFSPALQMLYQIDLLDADHIIAWHQDAKWRAGGISDVQLALLAAVRL